MAEKIYDMAIIGGGPAGYTAALYGARAGLDTLLFEKLSAGGQLCQTAQVDNYPGFEEGIDGFLLGEKMQRSALRFGAQVRQAEVLSVRLEGTAKKINIHEKTIIARTVIIAAGAGHKRLGVEREEAFAGRGVGYCAACDGMFYKGKTVAVVGGGNSAAADALHLSRICEKVILIHRRETLRAEKVYHEPLKHMANVEFRWNSQVMQLLGEDKLRGVVIRDTITGENAHIACEGVFISIGRTPASDIFKNQIHLDRDGYVIADETTVTNIPGVFAAGDIRTKPVRQIVTAVADGATAVHYAQEYLSCVQAMR